MKTFMKVILGLSVLGLLALGGCALLIGGAAEEVQKESDKHAITPAQYKSVKIGDTKKQTIKKLGEPMSEDSTEAEVPKELEDFGGGKVECIQYNRKGELASLYQFCFTDGRLDIKSSI